MRDRIFYTVSFGFLLGVLVRSFIFANFFVVVLGALLALAILFILLLVGVRKWGIVFVAFIFSFSLGVVRFHISDIPPPRAFEAHIGKDVMLAGFVADEPLITDKNQKLIVSIENGQESLKILLFAGFEREYAYGDAIKFSGTLQKPDNFTTEQGKVFDYAHYLRKDGIFYTMAYPDIEVISSRHGNLVKQALFAAKRKFLEKINLAISAPESLLMGGLILGERAAWSDELRQDFTDTGTIHIVALSGYNVTLVAEWVMKILSTAPRSFAFGAGMLSIALFVLMTGASSTAVRAGIMAILALLARATGRGYDVARAMILAAVVMILCNPFILAYDVSFQLSFLATVAVIFFTPRIEKYFMWITRRFGLRDIASVTVAAYIFVFPFILYKMGNFSLVALPANFLVLPFIPLTMAAGFITGALGFIWYGLAIPSGFITALLLKYELGIIHFLGDLPFTAFSVSHVPFLAVLLIYAAFARMLFGQNIKNFFSW